MKKGLSAGRVQSVTLKVICEREQEIDNFIPQEYWSIDADLQYKGKTFTASLRTRGGEKISIKNKEETDTILKDLGDSDLIVEQVKKQERKKRPAPPFITSKLQQAAAKRLGFNTQKSMIVAQQLYEGVDITGEGPVGLITYIRTDSTRVSTAAMDSVRKYIGEYFSGEYLPESPNQYKNKKGAQDAHEAIRPTDVFRTPQSIKGDLTREQYRLYEMIWKGFVSSQMTPEVSEVVTVDMSTEDYGFRATGSKVLFKGYTAVDNTDKTEKNPLPKLEKGDRVEVIQYNPGQHFTTPPPRYNDASLVKFLEESGIGRPSTYAPTINTLIKRYYVTRSGRQLVPTVLGKLVNDIMSKHFTSLVSIDFTANMEEKLDLIEDAHSDWVKMLHEFYSPFKNTVEDAEENIEEMKNILDEETDVVCEECGRKMIKRLGRYGFFLACSGFPECRNAKSLPLGTCPKCGDGEIVKRSSKKGRGSFYGCNRYPECDFMTREQPAEKECPRCGSLLFSKKLKSRGEQLRCLNEGCGFHKELLDENNNGPAN